MLPFLTCRITALLFVFFAALTSLFARSDPPHPALSVKPAPTWIVRPLDPFREVATAEEQTADLDYLVSERQILVSERAAYVHFAYRITAAAGLSDAAEFSITFDPAYETVALHHLRLTRDGRTEERLQLGEFEVIRQERDRDRSLYDGRLTAIHQLRDVRVGDVIESAYTITGANPVFGNHYVDSLSLGWGKPVRQFRYRVVGSAGAQGRPFFRILGDDTWPPAVIPRPDGGQELLWERSPLAAVNPDANRPGWHLAYPFVQLGDFADWAEVVAWALPLYAAPPLTPALHAKIEELRGAAPDAAGRTLAALAFVQDEIRYLGIELGANSHRPSPPDETFARRFGDCKDKTLLLCTLLRGLGIEADPALVNTWMGRTLTTPLARSAAFSSGLHASLPTPLAFDHVIARVKFPGGETLWLDPTRLHQTGPLPQRSSSDFGQALIIRAGETGLVDQSIPAALAGSLHEKITFTSHAFDRPVDMDVTSTYVGERATAMRSYLASRTAEQLQRDYLDYYLQKLPGLTSRTPLNWEDDKRQNRISIHERYSIPGFWGTAEKPGIWQGEIYPYSISDLVRTPGTQTRRTPLSIAHPSETKTDIQFHLHGEWDIGPLEHTVENAFVSYASSARKVENTILLSYHYRTKEDHVPSDRVAAYAASLAEIRGDLGVTLTKDTNPAAPVGYRINPWSVFVALVAACVGFWVSWRVLRRRRRRRREDGSPTDRIPTHAAPAIGGWLILFAIGIIVRCVTAGVTSVQHAPTFFDLTIWENLTAADSTAHNPALAALILAELVGNIFLNFLVWMSAILFFQRRRTAPLWNGITLVYIFVFTGLDTLASSLITDAPTDAETWKTLYQSLIACAIWVPYLKVSQRVKETFVR